MTEGMKVFGGHSYAKDMCLSTSSDSETYILCLHAMPEDRVNLNSSSCGLAHLVAPVTDIWKEAAQS